MPRIYVALDLEFTGLNPDRDSILEVGAVKFQGPQPLDTWSCLTNPGRALSHKVQRLTGITPQDLERAPSFQSLLPSLSRFVGEYPIVGHSVGLDLTFLQRGGLTLPNPAIDTFELASILVPYASRYSLARLAEELGIDFPKQHRALEDAQATQKLFLALLDRAAQLNPKILQEIGRLSERSEWPLKLVFQDILRDRVRQAFAPGSIGAQLAAKGLHQDDEFGMALTRDKDEQPLRPVAPTARKNLDPEQLAQLLEPGSAFSRRFPGFEYRPEQVKMLTAVSDAVNQGATLLVEAGTGTGKSLAYLLPAVFWAAQNRERVVISTNTINLQDQLYFKDIPDLGKALRHIGNPVEFKATVLKGRSNYLCRNRLTQLRKQDRHSNEEVRILAKILAWLPSTTTGDVAELTLTPAEQQIWPRLASDPDYCTPDRCGHRADPCFFWRARARAESSHLVIVNHALLLSDMALENRVLPEFKYLIVDEAHHLETRATEALAFEASKSSLEQLFRAVGVERSGMLASLLAALRASDAPQSAQREFARLVDETGQTIDRARRAVYEFFNVLETFLAHQDEAPGEEGGYERQVRLTLSRRNQSEWTAVQSAWEPLDTACEQLGDKLVKVFAAWDGFESYDIAGQEDSLQEILASQRRVGETRAALNDTVNEPRSTGIYWASLHKNTGDVALHAAPLNVAQTLQKNLFATREAVILTSATLRVGDTFSYISSRLGLGDWADTLAVGSPFDFASAALLYVPTDIPEPGQAGYQKAVESSLADLLRATGGRALVLFTSHSQLQNTYRAVARRLEEADILVLAQGLDGSRRQVLDTFKANPRMALFGTRSFWEGIDVVGEALSCLVMARLPFAVPSDPIFAARSETFDDPFAQYAVPEAVLRFRQGFGRLIRSKSDHGIVVILDKRILTKAYGQLFLESLPPCSKKQGPLKELPNLARAWLGESEPLEA